MKINEKIITTLKSIGLPIFYITRADKKPVEWIIFNYIKSPNTYADMKEEKTEYTILVNIYCLDENLGLYSEQAETLLKTSGFTAVIMENAFLTNDDGVENKYCVPLSCKYIESKL